MHIIIYLIAYYYISRRILFLLSNHQHVTEAETDDAVNKVLAVIARHGEASVASINVDNAARPVAKAAIDRLRDEANLSPIILNHDLAHTVDLWAKDMSEFIFVIRLMKNLDKVFSFVSTDRIDSIRLEMISEGTIPYAEKAKKNADTRMHGLVDYLRSLYAQKAFLSAVQIHPSYTKYYDERSNNRKAALDELFDDVITTRLFKQIALLCRILKPLKDAVKFFSGGNAPVSAAVLVAQALRNELNSVIGLPSFDSTMGEGASAEVSAMLESRCNLDLEDTPGRKVAMLSSFHGWANALDPFMVELGAPSMVEVDRATLIKEMICFFVPECEDTRRALWMEYQVRLPLLFAQYILLHALF